jgi:hypothetical protein
MGIVNDQRYCEEAEVEHSLIMYQGEPPFRWQRPMKRWWVRALDV